MKRFLAKHSPLFILAGLCLAMALYSADFRTTGNLQSVANRTSVIGVIAVGQLLVILIAGIDLSVGSVAALSGVVGCMAMKSAGLPVPLGILAGTATGLVCGSINGVLVAYGRIPPFIVTLGMMMAARGMAMVISGGLGIAGLPASFYWLGGVRAWWVPVIITVTVALVFTVVLHLTKFGRALYAIGGNRSAARLSGLPVARVQVAAFALCGMLAGFAGMMLASKSGTGLPTAAEMYELDTIAACVIGGASLMGGEGGAIAALAGALIMMVLQNFCNLENIDTNLQRVFIGVLIIALVFYDTIRKRRAGLIHD